MEQPEQFDESTGPMVVGGREMRTIKVMREIELTLDVEVEYEDNDDGCGDSSTTGNSMTGRRGRTLVPKSIIVDALELIKAADASVGVDDGDIREKIAEAGR